MADLLVADVNNSRRVTDWTAYKAFSPVVIAKMTEGADYLAPSFLAHRRGAATAGLAAFGAYHFWTPGVPAARQAANALRAIGNLADSPAEWLILDVETGSAFDAYEEFCAIADQALGRTTWLYGGRQLAGHLPHRPRWVARYPKSFAPDPPSQPGIGEALWQFSDRYPVPGVGGVGADCSVHRGTLDSLLIVIRGDDVALDAKDVDRIADAIITRLGVDANHPYTGTAIRAAVDRLTAKVEALDAKIDGAPASGGDITGSWTATFKRE